MQRELNPSLFGSKSSSSSERMSSERMSSDRGQADRAPAGGPGDFAFPSQTSVGLKVPGPVPPEFRALEATIQQLKLQLQASDKRCEILAAQMQELARTTTSRFERVSQALTRLEGAGAQQFQELNSKYSTIASKVNERKVQDVKIQEMIDRHNHIVRSFENRLTHMQRVISEQEIQLHSAQAALEEARHELLKPRRP